MAHETYIQGKSKDGSLKDVRTDSDGRLASGYVLRDAHHTGFATLNSNAETELIVGEAGHYHDLVMITAANGSDAAVTFTIQNGTGGSTILEIVARADISYSESFSVPIPSAEKGQAWTVAFKDSDVSNTEIAIFGMAVESSGE